MNKEKAKKGDKRIKAYNELIEQLGQISTAITQTGIRPQNDSTGEPQEASELHGPGPSERRKDQKQPVKKSKKTRESPDQRRAKPNNTRRHLRFESESSRDSSDSSDDTYEPSDPSSPSSSSSDSSDTSSSSANTSSSSEGSRRRRRKKKNRKKSHNNSFSARKRRKKSKKKTNKWSPVAINLPRRENLRGDRYRAHYKMRKALSSTRSCLIRGTRFPNPTRFPVVISPEDLLY